MKVSHVVSLRPASCSCLLKARQEDLHIHVIIQHLIVMDRMERIPTRTFRRTVSKFTYLLTAVGRAGEVMANLAPLWTHTIRTHHDWPDEHHYLRCSGMIKSWTPLTGLCWQITHQLPPSPALARRMHTNLDFLPNRTPQLQLRKWQILTLPEIWDTWFLQRFLMRT